MVGQIGNSSAARPPYLDHVVVATPDLDATVARVAACTGVAPVPGGEHPQFHTRNYLVSLGGDSYIEFIGAVGEPDPGRPRPFRLDEIDAPTAATWAVHAPDPDDTLRRTADHGVQFGPFREGRRRTAEGDLIRWRLTDQYVVEPTGLVPFVIDWGTTPSPARTVTPRVELRRFSATHPDPASITTVLGLIGTGLGISVGSAALHLEIAGPQGSWSPDCCPEQP